MFATNAAEPIASLSFSNKNPAPSTWQMSASEKQFEGLNNKFATYYLACLAGVVILLFLHTSTVRYIRHIRTLTSLGGCTQRIFATASEYVAWFKVHVFYAPLLFHRRSGSLTFGKYLDFGVVPSRVQAITLVLLFGTNLLLALYKIPWSGPKSDVLADFRNRLGTLAVVNFIPIALLATINNPLVHLLGISYDTFIFLHRWFGRISVLEAIGHVICYLVWKVRLAGWKAVRESLNESFIQHGLVPAICLVTILFTASKPVRSMMFELFLHIHVVLVAVAFGYLWFHLLRTSVQRGCLLGAIVIWAATRLWRISTLIIRSLTKTSSKALVELLPGDALRLTISPARPWEVKPGQSIYLTVPSIGGHTAHPFSVAWSDISSEETRASSLTSFTSEKPSVRFQEDALETPAPTTISLIIKKRCGFTRRLYEHSRRCHAVDIEHRLTALVEGPYGNQHNLDSFGTVMLFAGGVGITHQMLYIRHLLEGHLQGIVATRKITLVWVVPTADCLEWIRPWMHEILAMENRREVLKVLLYVTGSELKQQLRSPSDTVRMLGGRPDVEDLVRREAVHRIGFMAISVCGTGGLADDVRRASRIVLAQGVNLDFFEEGFGW